MLLFLHASRRICSAATDLIWPTSTQWWDITPRWRCQRATTKRCYGEKIFDHSPQIAIFCDKLAARVFVRRRLPDLELPDVFWIGKKGDDIPDEILNEDVVIKCNHGCDYNFFWHPDTSDGAEIRTLTQA